MISINDVTFTYPKSAKPALVRVSAMIPEGISLLVGENGAGKTTLLYAIAGLVTPQTGEITVNDNPSTSMLPSARENLFMLDDNLKITATTIRGFQKVHSGFYSGFSRDSFEANLKAFGLTGDEPIRKLSLGNRKKTLLSYALSLGVNVLLLDEPTNGLDIQSKDTLRRIIASQTTNGQSIIISTHNVGEFKNLYDGFIALHKGHLRLAATADRITKILDFTVSPRKDANSLYSELSIGGYATIRPACGENCSDIEWELLYKALMSSSGDQITSLFTSENENDDYI
ncbi:MAG: ABC transporter ATP-binding protein [Muribaculum sp.]|nr:ABC transporter ATP-binding protein [Muribaculum sp.]